MSKSVFVTRPIPEAGLSMLREHGYNVDVNSSDAIPSHDDTYYENMETMLPHADVISLHISLLPTARHLINDERDSILFFHIDEAHAVFRNTT